MQNIDALLEIRETFGFNEKDAAHVLAFLVDNAQLDSDIESVMYEYYVLRNEMPYGVAKARTGDPQCWIGETLCKELGLPL